MLESWLRPEGRERNERDDQGGRGAEDEEPQGDRQVFAAAQVTVRQDRCGGGEERRDERGEDRSSPDQGTISSSIRGSARSSSSTS
jgi:hypothetical protein